MVQHARFTQVSLAHDGDLIDTAAAGMSSTAMADPLPHSLLLENFTALFEKEVPAMRPDPVPAPQPHVFSQQQELLEVRRPDGGVFDLRTVISMVAQTALKHTINISQGSPLWALGLILMILGTVSSGLGMLCLKRANGMTGLPWYRNGWFWGGITLFCVTAAGLDVIVFAITPLSLIAPFAGLTIVVSFLLAYLGCCGVKEEPSKTTLVAVFLITFGVTICSVFGPKTEGQLYPRGLHKIFDDHPWLFWLSLSGGVSFGIFVATVACYQESMRATLRSWAGALSLAMISAFFAALSQLQFKSLASAVFSAVTAVGGGEPIPHLYASSSELATQLVSVASAAVAQIGFLNYAISVAPVAYSVPAYQAGLLLLTLLLSGWVLQEFKAMTFDDEVLFWLGAIIVGFGMLLNAWGLAKSAEAKRKEEEAALGDEALVDAGLAGSKVPWEDEYPGGNDDPESAKEARKAASMRFG